MEQAKVWVEKVTIPTYGIGEPEKNPIFLDKRVYQGSCGKVYPYATVETISDEKTDQEYEAVYLENEYIKVMVLPELGGRIQRAYDKTNQYDFVYYNQVIKPALVGLTGPWISGGIEFNWPQHHRPTTFLPVDYTLEETEKYARVYLHDVDQMYGTKVVTMITVYPGKAYIEITGQLYNRTSTPQTFLWWANPAVAVNEHTQSIFPPDVHAVMDHGKRDVSRFPIATGVYYKHDYSEGVDISRYKNIPVPTSYMAEKSKYDFVGGYDYQKQAGLLHVADHHVSPGKKQWTWGCGDFGKAWDRNLTDEDGPYIELMTGMFTDNQPDFTWLKPFEEKSFKQYFMPYKGVGQVCNASKECAVHLSVENHVANVIVYASSRFENANVTLWGKGKKLLSEEILLSPTELYTKKLEVGECNMEDLYLVVSREGRELVSYLPEKEDIPKLPEPAKAAPLPAELKTNEELYLTGLHIEQYRHATYSPDDYYLEGLKRDPQDIRINNAYGSLCMRRGNFQKAQEHFETAISRLTYRNPNPYNSESYYLLGLVLWYQGKMEEAYDAFYKATWSNEQQETSFYYLACIDTAKGRFSKALAHVKSALIKNSHNVKARGLLAYLYRKMELPELAAKQVEENLEVDCFDLVSYLEGEKLRKQGISVNVMKDSLGVSNCCKRLDRALMVARDYGEFGAYEEACEVLEQAEEKNPLSYYYKAYYQNYQSDALACAESSCPDYCFPNKIEDCIVLEKAIEMGAVKKAPYYLGNFYLDKGEWEKALPLFEMAAKEDVSFPTVFRNLSLIYYNKCRAYEKAKEAMEHAYSLNEDDVRILLELDQLYKKLGMNFSERLSFLKKHETCLKRRDDLYIEYITLLNRNGHFEEAYEAICNHHFHPWEGGEGKITTQYVQVLIALAQKAEKSGSLDDAEEYLKKALVYPDNLGEGRLEGTKDNHLYYFLGKVLQGKGRCEEAKHCFEKATEGNFVPTSAMYYNDQPADMILYQGLAYQELGKKKEANAKFYSLLDYGEQHLSDEVKIEYFAVSLPDFLIFDSDLTKQNQAHCYYLMGLSKLGTGQREKAREFFEKALELEPSHLMAHTYLTTLVL